MDVDVDDDRGMSGAIGGGTTADDDVLRAKDEAIAVGWLSSVRCRVSVLVAVVVGVVFGLSCGLFDWLVV